MAFLIFLSTKNTMKQMHLYWCNKMFFALFTLSWAKYINDPHSLTCARGKGNKWCDFILKVFKQETDIYSI